MKASKMKTTSALSKKSPKIPNAVRLALERQHDELFRVQGIIGCVGKAIEEYFGGSLPRDLPLANLALEAASSMVERIAFALQDEDLIAVGQSIAKTQATRRHGPDESHDDD